MVKKKLKSKWKIIFIILFIVLFTLFSARFIGTKGLNVREYKVVNSNLPSSFYGLKVVQFSDLHFGMSVNEKVLENLVEKINTTKPDIVFFTGDLIDKDTVYTGDLESLLIKYLSKIESTYGNYYVSGNHDKYKSSFNSLMAKCNFISLDDKYDTINNSSNNNILIAGIDIDSSGSYLSDVLKKNKFDYKILLMLYPDTYDSISKYNFDLILSGHSHNGQVRIPVIGAVVKPHDAKKYYNEYYKIDNTDFYISGGIGNSTLNLRLFNKPSFNLYRLVDK